MARVTTHLSVSDLEREYRAAKDATAARHYQAIWLLAKGHTVPAVAEMTSFGTRRLQQALARHLPLEALRETPSPGHGQAGPAYRILRLRRVRGRGEYP